MNKVSLLEHSSTVFVYIGERLQHQTQKSALPRSLKRRKTLSLFVKLITFRSQFFSKRKIFETVAVDLTQKFLKDDI